MCKGQDFSSNQRSNTATISVSRKHSTETEEEDESRLEEANNIPKRSKSQAPIAPKETELHKRKPIERLD